MIKMKININKQNGVVALSVTLLLGAIIVEIGAIGVLLAYTLNSVNYGARLSAEARLAAKSGVSDAMLRLIRDKRFTANPAYVVEVGGRTVDVLVCNGAKTVSAPCDTVDPGKAEVTSTGLAFPKQIKLEAIVDIAPITGEIRLITLKEL